MVDRLTIVNRCEACAWSTTWICYTGRLERLKLTTIQCHSKRHCSFPCHVNSKTHSIVGSHKNAFTICNLEYWTIEVALKAGNAFVVLHACTLHLSIAGCYKNTFAIWNLEYWTIEVALWARNGAQVNNSKWVLQVCHMKRKRNNPFCFPVAVGVVQQLKLL